MEETLFRVCSGCIEAGPGCSPGASSAGPNLALGHALGSRARLVWPGVVRAVFVAVCVFGMLVIWGVVCAVPWTVCITICLACGWCGLWSAACGMLGVLVPNVVEVDEWR